MTMAQFEAQILDMGYETLRIISITRLIGDSDARIMLDLGDAGRKVVIIENGCIVAMQG